MNTKEQSVSPNNSTTLPESPNHSIKCVNVNLKSCALNVILKEKIENQKLKFSVHCSVFDKLLVSELRIKLYNLIPDSDQFAQSLSFTVVGLFTGEGDTSKSELGEFGKFASLTILWPYAREFSQSLLQRTGFPFECLPVINTQAMNEKMIQEKTISVDFPDEPTSEKPA